ncbi:MAG: protein translocase subunit SecD [Patescibacteria group bacterium]|nr:protein translocase subunit SecD [Patescibacteria group bacterium]
MIKRRFWAVVLILAAALVGYFVYASEKNPSSNFHFKQGLDLAGGTELVYKPDLSKASSTTDLAASMSVLRDVIERRVNTFGVSEPVVRVEQVGLTGSADNEQLIVDLPGVTNIDTAIAMIGETPTLDFMLLSSSSEKLTAQELQAKVASSGISSVFEETGLTGEYLQSSSLQFDQTTGEPQVALQFNGKGADLFASITKNNVNRHLAIFLDGYMESMPVIQEEIDGGQAVISGGFTGSSGIKDAKALVDNLNLGALPIPIQLISTQSIGASLGHDAVAASTKAGIVAFLVIAAFLILVYRLPGFLATLALGIYTALNLAIFKLIPVTLTSAGIAAFILSVGMAVDANILIFERMKEEFRAGREIGDAVSEGFKRAWTSIRDSNISSMITAVILYMFSSTSVVKGFALVFFIGVAVSMFTAITASRTLLLAIKHERAGKFLKWLFGAPRSNQ